MRPIGGLSEFFLLNEALKDEGKVDLQMIVQCRIVTVTSLFELIKT